MGILTIIFRYQKLLILILTPILLLPIVFLWTSVEANISKCAYVVAVMAVYWTTEAASQTVTAMIPMFAFPLLGVRTSLEVANSYSKDTTLLFIGSLTIGAAVEDTNLHKRIALLVLNAMGAEPKWMLLGIMISTAGLSMFMINTAAAALMMPIVMTICEEVIKSQRSAHRAQQLKSDTPMIELNRVDPAKISEAVHLHDLVEDVEISVDELDNKELRLTKAMLLAMCYSSSLGGTATLTGTPPNVIMVGLLNSRYGSHPVNYGTWLAYNGPGCILNMFVAWLWIQLALIGPRSMCCSAKVSPEGAGVKRMLRRQLRDLGPVSWAEGSVLAVFVSIFITWCTRTPVWGRWFIFGGSKSFATDGTASILFALLLFVLPRFRPRWDMAEQQYSTILTWKAAEKKIPWGIVLLLGGGFAVGDAVRVSGLSELIGLQLFKLPVSDFWLVGISMALMTFTTEFTSNTATASIILPIVTDLAEKRCINPLYLTLPVSEASSFAYMLPVATPPNAIVFGAGVLRTRDMMMLGLFMNIFCMLEVMLSINTWGWAMFSLDRWPVWAGNGTGCA